MKLGITVSAGADSRELAIEQLPVTVGRHADCEVQVDDARASRRHARIELRGGRPCIVDLESGNGTIVNGLPARECFLSPGDEIQIGDAVIRVESIEADRPERPAEAAPSPEALAVRSRAARRLRRRRVLARVGPVLVLAALGGAIAWWATRPAPPASGPDAAASALIRAARDELARLDREAGTAPRVTAALILEAEQAAARYSAVRFAGGQDRFGDLLQSLRGRQRTELMNRLHLAKASAAALVSEKRFGEAVRSWEAERDAIVRESPELAGLARPIGEDLAGRVASACSRIEEQIQFFSDLRRDEDALRLCEEAESLFAGTAQAATLAERRAEIRRRIAEQEEQSRRLIEQLVRADEEEASKSRPAAREARLAGIPGLIAEPIAGGALAGKEYELGGAKGRPVGVDGQDLVVASPAGSRKVAFSAVPPAVQLAMARDALAGAALLRAARLGFARRESKIAGEILWRYVAGAADDAARSGRAAEAGQLLAKVRGLAKVPEGGFVWSQDHGWETAGDRADREAIAAAEKQTKVLASASTLVGLEKSFGKVAPLLSSESLSAGARARARQLAIDALSGLRKKLAADLARQVKKTGFSNLRAASQELKRRRAEALRVIFDTAIYLPENHPDWPKGDKVNGQEAVDKAVAAVRELWENAASYAVALDPRAEKLAAMIRAIDGKCFGALHHLPEKGDAPELDEILLNLDRRIDLRHYAANRAEADLYLYNRKVEAYNRDLKDPELPEADREHVIFLNDYREMMGLRRVFIEPRLCRATRKHSEACNAAGRIWHVGPDGSPSSRAQAEGFGGGVAENVAIGYANPRDIWTRGWYRASDHHRNALGAGHTCMGYGYVGNVGTQNFASAGAPF